MDKLITQPTLEETVSVIKDYIDDKIPHIEWKETSNINNYIKTGIYLFSGYRKNKNDNLPIDNYDDDSVDRNNISFTLIVNTKEGYFDSTVPRNIPTMIAQTLMLGNRRGGDTKIYTRNAQIDLSTDKTTWTQWKELITSTYLGVLKSYTDEILNTTTEIGLYTGAIVNVSNSIFDVFKLEVINNYAIATQVSSLSGTTVPNSILQTLTKLTLDGSDTVIKRIGTWNGTTYIWNDWENTKICYDGKWSDIKVNDSYTLCKYKTIILDSKDCGSGVESTEFSGYYFTGIENKKYNYDDLFLFEGEKCLKPVKCLANGVEVGLYQQGDLPIGYSLRLDNSYTNLFPLKIESYYYFSGKKIEDKYLNTNTEYDITFGDVVLYNGCTMKYKDWVDKGGSDAGLISIGVVIDPIKRTFMYTTYPMYSSPYMYPITSLPDDDLLKSSSGLFIKQQLIPGTALYTSYYDILEKFKARPSAFYTKEGNILDSVPDYNCFIPTIDDLNALRNQSSYKNDSLNCGYYTFSRFIHSYNPGTGYTYNSLFYAYSNAFIGLGRTITKSPNAQEITGKEYTETYPITGQLMTKTKSDWYTQWHSYSAPFYVIFGIY